MYLRTSKRKNKDGTTVAYYQLAHNKRHPVTKNPVPKIIHSFGRADRVDRDLLVRLCKSIARVCNLEVIDPIHDRLPEERSTGFPKDLRWIKALSYGPVLVIEAIWKRLGINRTFRNIQKAEKLKVPYERALLAMVANRLCEPESKLGVWDRWLEKVYLPSCQSLKLEQMYEAMDLFYNHVTEVEKDIFFHTADLFNLDVDVIFYDATTASFAIDREDEHDEGLSRKFGRSKDGVWSPQIIVALAVTREGLPVRFWVFPGNTADVSTVEQVRADLKGWKLGRALFVGDAGMNSEDNRKRLSRACGKYLLATRMASVTEVKNDVLSKRGRYTVFSDCLKAKEVVIGEGVRQRRYVLCCNPKEARRQKKHRAAVVKTLELELAKHPSKKVTQKWAVKLLASKRYNRYLTLTKSNTVRIDRYKIRYAARYDGKWVLETNDDTLTLEDVACGYKGLMIIERCFRALKRTQLKMCPIFHQAPRRIETHVKICVLSLLIERIAEIACDKPWPRIRHTLDKLQVSEFKTINHRFHRRN